MKCVNLLEQVDDGQIWLGNTDITDPRADQDKIRARIGVVFQQFNLFPHMSVLRNVTLAAIKVHHWSKDRAETRAMELLERIGMRDKASAYPRSALWRPAAARGDCARTDDRPGTAAA